MQFDSSQLLEIARIAHARSVESPRDALVAVLFAAAAVEAFVNEFPEILASLRGVLPEKLRGLEELLRAAEEQNASTALKLQIIATSTSGQGFDKGRQPYQDYALLSSLRNRLVHLKPVVVIDAGSETMRPAKSDVVEKLRARGLALNTITSPSAWMAAISTPSVARWAHNTAAGMMTAITDLMPPGISQVVGRIVIEQIKPLE